MNWRARAACRGADPELFFPIGRDDVDRPEIDAAKEICAGCSVLDECLAYALTTHQPDGIWGGLTTSERRRLARRRSHARGAM